MKLKALFLSILLVLPSRTGASADNDNFILVIDPGHGGKDPGAVNGKHYEKTVNLDVALIMGSLIEKQCKNVKVIYTRKTDVFVELYRRAEIANKAGADMFISIHCNSSTSKSPKGAETYLLGVEEDRASANLNVALTENSAITYEKDYEAHYEGYDPNSPESMIIFEFMQNEHQKESLKMAGMVQSGLTGYAKRYDRGVHQAGYLVLWKNAMPSILVELGFISNQDECKYLTSKEGTEELAVSLQKSFSAYLDYFRDEFAKSVEYGTIQENAEPATDTPPIPDKTDYDEIVYKIQFATTSKEISLNDKRFDGLENVSFYKDGNTFKYTCYDTNDMGKIQESLKKVRKFYRDAFVVSFKGGTRVK